MKRFAALATAAALSSVCAMTSLAGTWKDVYGDGSVKEYYDDNGVQVKNGWVEDNGNKYYFQKGYLAVNAVVEDGSTVDQNGVWDGGQITCYASLPENVGAAYKRMLQGKVHAEEYCLFDINKDGIADLLIKEGTCEADYEWNIYTWNGSGTTLDGKIDGGHSNLAVDKEGQLYIVRAHMGEYQLSKILLSAKKLTETVAFSGAATETEGYDEFNTKNGVFSLPTYGGNTSYYGPDYKVLENTDNK